MGFRALKKTLEALCTTKVNNRVHTSRGTTLNQSVTVFPHDNYMIIQEQLELGETLNRDLTTDVNHTKLVRLILYQTIVSYHTTPYPMHDHGESCVWGGAGADEIMRSAEGGPGGGSCEGGDGW